MTTCPPTSSSGPLASGRHAGDESSLLARVLLDVERLIPCDRALIWLIDDDRQTLSTFAGRERGTMWNPGWTQPLDWPAFAPAIDDNAFVMLPREHIPGMGVAGDRPHARHLLLGPIQHGDRALGVLSLSRIDDSPFDSADLQTLQTMAGITSIAVRASLSPDRIPCVDAPAESGGQWDDLRSLGLLVGLAQLTSHMIDLPSLVEQMLAMLCQRLEMSLVLVLGTGGRRHTSVNAYSQRPEGHGVHPCPESECLDTLLGADLPANLESIPGFATLPMPTQLVRSPANAGVVALRTEDEVSGALIFEPVRPERCWQSDLEVIEAIAPHISAAINVARIHEQVKEDALTDGLTGALNYRALQQRLAELIDAADPFAVLMFDVVGLKPLNDTVGHLAGDQILRHSAEVIRAAIGPECVVGRIGGDEFEALLSGDDAADPQAIGRRIVGTMERDVAAAYRHTVTLRFGWATWPIDGRAPDLLLHVADQRMYLNHPSGRNATRL